MKNKGWKTHWKIRTKSQGWKLHDWKTQDQISQGWKRQDHRLWNAKCININVKIAIQENIV